MLVLELSLIRQIPAEVRAISFFTNLLLMASFLGLGVGCLLARSRSLAAMMPVGIAMLFVFVALGRGITTTEEADAVHFWLYEEGSRKIQFPLFGTAIVAYLVAALPFVALGVRLSNEMDNFPRLVAYAWDIGGSLIGTIAVAASAALSLPPWIWLPVISTLWAALFVREAKAKILHALPGFLFLLFAVSPLSWRWSPYYFVQHALAEDGLRVWVNSNFHQRAADFDTKDPRLVERASKLVSNFNIPYDIYRELHGGSAPKRVLVLGAGTGNDVAIAKRNGVEEVVAVEIDPEIIRLGRTLSPLRPYAQPGVRLVEDDARHFLWNGDERFDMVVLGTLDSLTLLSGYSNLRLENYVYTRESFSDMAGRLEKDGMIAAYYSVAREWLRPRLYATVRSAVGERMRLIETGDHQLFNTIILAAPGIEGFGDPPERAAAYAGGLPSTDDWPYLFLERPTIAPIYWKVGAFIGLCLLCGLALLRSLEKGKLTEYLPFLFLGLGFSLVESAAIVRWMLAFGSTWVVNPIVFVAVLGMIFVANALVHTQRAPPLSVAWVGLLVALVINALFPIPVLFGLSFVPRALVSIGLVGLPVFFAATCFSHLFARQTSTGFALGVNLLGVMSGGLLEYLSMIFGMQAMWWIIVAIYALAFATSIRQTFGAAR